LSKNFEEFNTELSSTTLSKTSRNAPLKNTVA